MPTRVASLPEGRGRSLPRVDPRDLLPRDFHGPSASRPTAKVKATEPVVAKAPTVAKPRSRSAAASDQGFGSLRSKILRDLRELREEVEPSPRGGLVDQELGQRTEPRVGSVLSQAFSGSNTGQLRDRIETEPRRRDFLRQATQAQVDARERPAEQRAAISKSIAAEVAEQMAAQQQPAASADAKPESSAPVSINKPPVAASTPKARPAMAVPLPQAASGVAAVADPFEDREEAASDEAAVAEKPPVAKETVPIAEASASAEGPTRQPTAAEALPVEAVAAAPAVDSAEATAVGPATAAPTKRISIGDRPASTAPIGELPVISFTDKQGQDSTAKTAVDGSPGAVRDDILITRTTPQIAAKVLGPRQVKIGQPARFQVHLKNRGLVSAEDLATQVRVPEWAEVASLAATGGVVERPTSLTQPIRWRMDRFAAGAGATMDLTLVAREGRPMELGVDWTHAPVSSHALIEVQEPKLQMQISGADEVYYGKPQLFRLTLSNPGNGLAEGVSLMLAPPGKPIEEATRHVLGDLEPGVSRSVEIELTAREAGQLALVAQANAAGGVTASVDKQVFCRKPEIKIDWRGPEQKYTGAQATYYFRVRNAGTAPAEGVDFNVTLPEGFEMTSTSEGQSYDNRRRLVRWRVGTLRPGDDRYMELKGIARTAGKKRLDAYAETADKLIRDDLTAVTNAIAVADLKLDVRDPKGPLPVGADAVYELRVKNRGSNVAEAVEVIALFSGGIEPLSVEGKPCRIANGRVTAPVIDRLAAGAEVVLRIHAKAIEPGTHILRAEVACRDLEIRLAAEEMTRFYADETLLDGDAPRAAGAATHFSRPR